MGGGAPAMPPEQRELLKTQERIASEEWGLKKPALETAAGWSRGEEIPSYYIPDFQKLINEATSGYQEKTAKAEELAGGLKGKIEEAYQPTREALEKYYGPAYVAGNIETIEREAARAREETIGIRGLPTNIERRLEEIETARGGARIETERIGALAKGAANIALEQQIGTEKANIEKVLANYEMAAEDELVNYRRAIGEQEVTFIPSMRLAALQLTQGLPAEQVYANLSNEYMNIYRTQLAAWQAEQESTMGWIGAFAKIGLGIGEIAGLF
jgi:hypothetical protein